MIKETIRTIEKGPDPIRKNLLGEGRFAIGFTLGLITFIFVGLIALSVSTALTSADIIELSGTLVALLIASVSLILSHQALTENRRMREAGTDPVVLVHLDSREDEPFLTTFNLNNVGAGAAMNVKVEVDADLDEFTKRKLLLDVTKIQYPIRTIPQNKSISYNLGTGTMLLENEPLPPFSVALTYEDIDGIKYKSTQTIDVREMHQRQAHTPPLTKISRDVGKIAKSFHAFSTGHKKMHVLTQSKQEYSDEQEKVRNEYLEHRNREEQ